MAVLLLWCLHMSGFCCCGCCCCGVSAAAAVAAEASVAGIGGLLVMPPSEWNSFMSQLTVRECCAHKLALFTHRPSSGVRSVFSRVHRWRSMSAVSFATDRKLWKITYYKRCLSYFCPLVVVPWSCTKFSPSNSIFYWIRIKTPYTSRLPMERYSRFLTLLWFRQKNTKKSFKTIYSEFHLAYSLYCVCVCTPFFGGKRVWRGMAHTLLLFPSASENETSRCGLLRQPQLSRYLVCS